jgi:hypothetical protein
MFHYVDPEALSEPRSFSGKNGASGCRVAGHGCVVEINIQNDDSYRTGNGPARAAVRSDPFVQPFAEPALAAERSGVALMFVQNQWGPCISAWRCT